MSAADGVPVLELRVAMCATPERVIFSLPLDVLLLQRFYAGADVQLGMAQPGTELVAVLKFGDDGELRVPFVVPDRSE